MPIINKIINSFNSIKIKNSIKWMPWLEYPKKDVLICDKFGEVDKKRYNSKISEWGNPIRVICIICNAEGHIVNWNI